MWIDFCPMGPINGRHVKESRGVRRDMIHRSDGAEMNLAKSAKSCEFSDDSALHFSKHAQFKSFSASARRPRSLLSLLASAIHFRTAAWSVSALISDLPWHRNKPLRPSNAVGASNLPIGAMPDPVADTLRSPSLLCVPGSIGLSIIANPFRRFSAKAR